MKVALRLVERLSISCMFRRKDAKVRCCGTETRLLGLTLYVTNTFIIRHGLKGSLKKLNSHHESSDRSDKEVTGKPQAIYKTADISNPVQKAVSLSLNPIKVRTMLYLESAHFEHGWILPCGPLSKSAWSRWKVVLTSVFLLALLAKL